MSLAGTTMFISGAIRGIGLAIAKRAAADGANIALMAKTAEPHPKLQGTIYTAAKEMRGSYAVSQACITLWPRTLVATVAVQNPLGGEEAMGRARKPEVYSDAA